VATVVNLLLGSGGAYTPPPADAIHLVLGGGGFIAPGTPLGSTVAARWGVASAARAGHAVLPWADAAEAGSGFAGAGWGRNINTRGNGPRLPWGDASPARRAPRLPWGAAQPALAGPRLPWQRGEGAQQWARLPWQRGGSAHRQARLPWQRAGAATRTARLPWGAALLVIAPNRPLPRPPALRPPSGVVRWVNLRICGPLDPFRLHLRLGVDHCLPLVRATRGVILPATTYMQVHDIQFVRLAGPLPLDVWDWSFDASDASFGRTLQFTGPVELMTQLAPVAGVPAQVRLTLDGLQFDFVVQKLRRNRAFANTSCTVTARSAGVLLGDRRQAQRAWLNTVPMTAQQIVEDVLQFTGVGLDWRVDDWLVPAGVWSFTGTPLAAVRRVADAIGAVLASPRTGDQLIVAPLYPLLPWEWSAATPDVVVALDAVEVEGMEEDESPPYEGVYLSGQQQGVLALVKRQGTAPDPDLMLPLVTDPLLTDLEASRQRGESLLGAAGKRATMTLRMIVATGPGEPGVIDPLELVEVPDPAGAWRGLVRAVRVEGNGGDVMQTLTVERHL